MTWPSAILSALYGFIASNRQTGGAAGLNAFTAWLNGPGNGLIRAYVPATPGQGHQSATANILRRLFMPPPNGLGYAGRVNVYLDRAGSQETFVQLDRRFRALLPELVNMVPPYRFWGGTLNTIDLKQPPKDTVKFGLSGGSDDNTFDYAKKMNVDYFLRLQPYRWGITIFGSFAFMPQEIRFLDKTRGTGGTLNLTSQKALGGATLAERAYKQRMATIDWATFPQADQRAQIIKWLIAQAAAGGFDLMPVYGVNAPQECAMGKPAQDRVVEILAALRAAQGLAAAPRPAVALNLSVFEPSAVNSFAQIGGILNGGRTNDEALGVVAANAQHETARKAYLTALNPDGRHYEFFIYEPGNANNLTNLQAAVAANLNGHGDRVLWVQLGRVEQPPYVLPPRLFQEAFAGGTAPPIPPTNFLPPVFEGQNTANFMLNTGRPYFHVNQPDRFDIQYPTTLLGIHNDDAEIPRDLQDAASQLNKRLETWAVVPARNPAAVMGAMIQELRAENGLGPLNGYFLDIGEFYESDLNDKLGLVLSFMSSVVGAPPAPARSLADGEGGALAAIYESFSTAPDPVGFAAMLDPAGQIATFVAAMESLFAASFTLTGTQAARVPAAGGAIDTVTVTGTTGLFGTPTAVSAVFTAPNGPVLLDCRFTADVAWSPGHVPWMVFENPYVGFGVADADMPVYGVLGGTLKGPDITFEVELPPTDGKMAFVGTFEDPPSIAGFYTMTGGINLVSILPPPLNLVSALAVKDVRFVFDTEAATAAAAVPVILFDLGWSGTGMTLLPGLELDSVDIRLTITEPGQAASLGARLGSSFTIGTSPNAAVVAIGAAVPEMVFNGQLVSGEITLDDLLGMFVPGVEIVPPSVPVITQFSFSCDQKAGAYSVACQLGFDWTIEPFGTPLLTIAEVGLAAQRQAGAVTGRLSASLTLLPDDPKNQLTLLLAAEYLGKGQGWLFSGAQDPGQQQTLSITSLIRTYVGTGWAVPDSDYGINGLSVSAAPTTHTYSIAGKTAEPWPVPFLSDFTISGAMDLSYAPPAADPTGAPVLGGTLSALIDWHSVSIALTWSGEGGASTYTMDWGVLHAVVAKNAQGEWVATGSLPGQTLGGIVEQLLTFATGNSFGLSSPWDLLDSVPLGPFEVSFNFTTKAMSLSVDIGPIDLGFASIQSIGLVYDASGPGRKVMVALDGTFPWLGGAKLPQWDATKPETAPAPPGWGNKYIDLRLLALGQHVGLLNAPGLTSVSKAIDALRDLGPDGAPVSGPNQHVGFDPSVAWLVGMDFGLMRVDDSGSDAAARPPGTGLVTTAAAPSPPPAYTLQLSIVFADPLLYGLRIALDGPAAKILSGLVFEILYRRISDTVGVYQAELSLPTAMRTIDVGAYTLTFPTISLSVYTNGDFLADIGFPYNLDFSKSFQVQAIIPPGIPVLGAAGIYFGKLSSATTTQVPPASNGRFNPVIVFGFGAQVGFGKDVTYGILSAGFSVTVFGIIEGVIAKWCPNQPVVAAGDKNALQSSYYFWLQGSFGIMGRLYGSIDFAIVKASVDIHIDLQAQITYESYHDIPISVIASVDVTASLEIDLGLFSITLHFSFSMTIKETFSIHNSQQPGDAPWQVTSQAALLRTRRVRRRLRARLAPVRELNGINWDNLTPAAAVPKPALQAWIAPAVTVSGEGAANPAGQQTALVAMLALQSVDPSTPPAPGTPDIAFEALAKQILRWLVAGIQPGPIDQAGVDETIVTDSDLLSLSGFLADPASPVPIPIDKIEGFMKAQFRLVIDVAGKDQVDAAPFPMPPELTLTVPAYNGALATSYGFAGFNTTSATYLKDLRAYFDALAVTVQPKPAATAAAAVENEGLSIASFLFADYFRLLARQMIEACRTALRDFTHSPAADQTAAEIVTWINKTGALDSPFRGTIAAGAEATFAGLAGAFGYGVSDAELATANADDAALLAAGATLACGQQPDYVVRSGDTLNAVAAHFGIGLAELFADSAVLTRPGLIDPAAVLAVPALPYSGAELFAANPAVALDPGATLTIAGTTLTAPGGATFTSLAAAFGQGLTAAALATANADDGRLLVPGATIAKTAYVVQPRDTLALIATALGVSLADLVANVLDQAGLIAPLAVLAVPPVAYPAAANDTLTGVAQRFGVTVESLATPANLAVEGLFAAGTKLSVPHLPQFQVCALLREIRDTGRIAQIAGMTGRYSLHGLRLPTEGVTPLPSGADPAAQDCPLYLLSGQQFTIPPLTSTPFGFTLSKPPTLDWVVLPTGATLDYVMPEATVAPTGPAAQAAALQAFLADKSYAFDPPGTTVGAEATYRDTMTGWSVGAPIGWASAGAIALPYGAPPAGRTELRLWPLPAALVGLYDPAAAAGGRPDAPPRVAALLHVYDEASGAAADQDIGAYGWAMQIAVTVKRLPAASSGAGGCTYEVAGASESQITLLERFLSWSAGSSAAVLGFDLLYPGQAAAGAAGLQSDDPATVTWGIIQANLSTVTNPPSSLGAEARIEDAAPGACFNKAYDFIRLLWECSITRSGGFYLYYCDGGTGEGLPEPAFNADGEAALSLVLRLAAPQEVAAGNRLPGFVNALVTVAPFETGNASVVVRAAPIATEIAATASDSLATLGTRSYTDPIVIGEDNAGAPLAAGVGLTIARGLYVVGPAASEPGGDAASIASWFGTTAVDLQGANPQITDWSAALAPGIALRLPEIGLIVGSGQGGSTLAAIGTYYGCGVDGVAADNLTVPGLFAGATLTLRGGPTTRVAATPPGTVAIMARRAAPKAIPEPSEPDFGQLYLQSKFTLLGYRLAGNAWFDASPPGLPLGPGDTPPASLRADRRRLPTAVTGPLNYSRIVPVSRHAAATPGLASAVGPDPLQSPYRGLGGVAQLDLFWLDSFGNRILGGLGATPADTPTAPPVLPLLYTDAIVGLAQWPGVSSSWRVSGDPGAAVLAVLLSFDHTAYMVPTSNWQDRADRALPVYASLYYQLAAGLEAALESTLLASGRVDFASGQIAALQNWLFGDDGIYAFLSAQPGGGGGNAPADLELDFPIPPAAVNPAGLFELTMTLVLSRPATLLEPGFVDAAAVAAVRTAVVPEQEKTASGTHTLAAFAKAFEFALSAPDSAAVKLANGVDRRKAVEASRPLWLLRLAPAPGLPPGNGAIGYAIGNPGAPIIYAPRPLFNSLQAAAAVPIYPYQSGVGIDFTTAGQILNLGAVDSDLWLGQMLDAVDRILRPDLAAPAALVDLRTESANLDRLLAAKTSLACKLSKLLIPVFEGPAPSPAGAAAATEALRQQLLQTLSSFYEVSSAVQFSAAVSADINDPDFPAAPQLYGKLAPAATGGPSDPAVSLTSAKLPLATTAAGQPADLTFLARARHSSGAVEKSATLNLDYAGLQIEHQRGPLPNMADYLASTWLSFVLPPQSGDLGWPLASPLGSFELPLLLRSFPTPPTMVLQTGTQTLVTATTPSSLAQAVLWVYSFAYSLNFHYPQDLVHFTCTFNVDASTNAAMPLSAGGLIEALGEFVTVYPAVATDLEQILARVDQATIDAATLDKARIALLSFVSMVERVAEALAAPKPVKSAMLDAGTGQAPYSFSLSESSIEVGSGGDRVEALLITLDGLPPAGIDPPSVDIPGYIAQRTSTATGFTFTYVASEGDPDAAGSKMAYLPAEKGQQIGQRKITLPGLNILAAQNASSSGWILRNQHLVERRTTVESFLYQTSPVSFPTPLRPTFVVLEEIDIAAIPTGGPVARTLAEQLGGLFTALFAEAPAGPQEIQLTICYSVSVNPALPPIALPVVFVPPIAFLPDNEFNSDAEDGDPLSQAALSQKIATAITTWYQTNAPLQGGTLTFDLKVMTRQPPGGGSAPPTPLLELAYLVLNYADWTDHPADQVN